MEQYEVMGGHLSRRTE